MKKITLLVIALISLVGCNDPTIQKKNTGERYGHGGTDLQEMTYEGCQYIGLFESSSSAWGTHKGNCNNPIHQQNKVTVIDTVEYQLIRK